MLLAVLLKSMIKTGTLTLVDAGGRTHRFGDMEEPRVTVRLHDRALHTRLFLNPMLAVGEAYMDETLTIEDDADIYDFLALCLCNLGTTHGHWLQDLKAMVRQATRRIAQRNPVGIARRNVAHHYDLSDTLYALFLDKDRQYSCAYFATTEDDLDQAQENKKRHIAGQAPARVRQPGARYRIRLGRLGVVHLADLRRRRHGRHALHGTTAGVAGARRVIGPRRARPLPAERLSRCRRTFRPHRFRGHVRACRGRPLSRVLRQGPRPVDRGRHRPSAFHRPFRRARLDQPVAAQVHLPRRLRAGPFGGAAGDRAIRAGHHRHRDPGACTTRRP